MAEREWFDTDYYKVLGLTSSATDKEITRAYRKLAKEHHPDTNKGSEERFKEVSAAYDVLGDVAKRKEYDEVRRLGPAAAGFGGAAGPGNFNFQTGDFTDFGDVFSGLFGGGRQRRAQRGGDIEAGLHLSFRDAVLGVTTTVAVPSNEPCHGCRGRGAAEGGYLTCPTCGGRGQVVNDQGPFATSGVCGQCHGTGILITAACTACHGAGREPSSRKVNVRVPAGVVDGQRIRLKGKGHPGAHGGPHGDLFVDIHVAPDARFDRKARHVTTSVSVSVIDALLGTTVEVPTLDDPVTLKVAPGTQPGTTLRVRGRGVPSSPKQPAGDLLVTIAVSIPTSLTAPQRAAVDQLARALQESA